MGQNLPRQCNDNNSLSEKRHRWTRNNSSRNALVSVISNAFRRNRHHGTNFNKKNHALEEFPDLYFLPPEIGIEVLKNLNATDLCLASCVWEDLANDETLWEGLCKTNWGYCTAYKRWKLQGKSYKKLYLILDEACLTFNFQPTWGINYLIDEGVLDNNHKEIAMFFHCTNKLGWRKVRNFLRERQDVLEELIALQSYKNQFLPNALRKFFNAVDSPASRGQYLNTLMEKFSCRFCNDNPHLGLTPEIVHIICYSLILLSVDLSNPHVKNKMSKREFIKNICAAISEENRRHVAEQNNFPEWVNNNLENPANNNPENPAELARQRAIATVDKDFAGHLYDNIYLIGHVAKERWDE